MKNIGKLIIILGVAVILWSAYQYISNEPSKVSNPNSLSESIEALGNLYGNFEKAEKQSQAKDIGVVGIIIVFVGGGMIFMNRKPTQQT
jgi:hypothetical protein